MTTNALTIVTGASRGIGAAIAIALAKAGIHLALVSRSNSAQLERTAAAARQSGGRVSLHQADVSNSDDVTRLFDEINATGLPVRGLVNNAGFVGDRVALADASIAMIDQVFAVNVRGSILCCQHAVPLMARAGGGSIVNLSSQSAMFGGNALTAYAASKAAINGLTISLAREIAPQRIRVNAVSPGPVLTEPLQALPPERLAEMEKSLPMGRFCRADEVAETVTWLLSDRASYISGTIVPVHGAR